MIRRSPFAVRGSSVVPVCRPFSDQDVSPWRIRKARGVVISASLVVGLGVKGGRGEGGKPQQICRKDGGNGEGGGEG